MAKYLTKFADQAAYESGEKDYPNVSLVGEDIVYMAERPPYSGKARLTYTDESVVEVPDNGSSTLTSGEVSNRSALVAAEVGLLTTIVGESAFYGCTALTSVSMANSVVELGKASFYQCSGLTEVKIPSSVTTINSYTFQYCNGITDVKIPRSVTKIGLCAFSRCSALRSVVFEEGIQIEFALSGYAWGGDDLIFEQCTSLTSVTMPNGIMNLCNNMFNKCSGLTSVTIPDSVTNMGIGVFSECKSLISVSMPSGLTSIQNDTFYKCSGLTSITIPSLVSSISGGDVFGQCKHLLSITCLPTTPPTLSSSSTFSNSNTNSCPIYVPSESVQTYKAAQYWSGVSSRIQAIP